MCIVVEQTTRLASVHCTVFLPRFAGPCCAVSSAGASAARRVNVFLAFSKSSIGLVDGRLAWGEEERRGAKRSVDMFVGDHGARRIEGERIERGGAAQCSG